MSLLVSQEEARERIDSVAKAVARLNVEVERAEAAGLVVDLHHERHAEIPKITATVRDRPIQISTAGNIR